MALIFIVEDDSNIREIEQVALEKSGYNTEGFSNAADFYKRLKERQPDLVLLDVMLPDESGYNIVRRLRRHVSTRRLPVIMVTAKTAERDMIQGLDDGADDYIRKPFSIKELITRVKVLLRRSGGDLLVPQEKEEEPVNPLKNSAGTLSVGNLTMDLGRRLVTAMDNPVELTFKEFELLHLLMEKPGVALSREVIMHYVWDMDFGDESRTVDMHIKTLRQKLGDAGKQIKTIRNVGYVLEAEEGMQG